MTHIGNIVKDIKRSNIKDLNLSLANNDLGE